MVDWEALSKEHARSMVKLLARGKTALQWEATLRELVPYSVLTHTTTRGSMWMGMWMTYHHDEVISGGV